MFGPLVEHPPSRQGRAVTDESIASFWEDWPRLRSGLEADLAAGRYGEGTADLTELIEAIDPDLEWDLTPGRAALYALCLSAAADPGLRPLTERWLRAAPPPDPIWEYHPARVAVEPAGIVVEDIEIHPRDATVVVEPDPSTEELDLTVGHPDFRIMDEALRLQVVFRLLDDLLGEDATELWIGAVDAVPHSLPWGIPFLDLAANVEHQAATATGVRWEWSDKDDFELGRSRLAVNRALKRLDHLDLELFVTVSIEAAGADDPQVRRVEDDLRSTLEDGVAVFARRVFDDFTVLYAYADPACQEAIDELAERWRPAVYEVTTEPDPGWDNHDDLR